MVFVAVTLKIHTFDGFCSVETGTMISEVYTIDSASEDCASE